MRDVLQKTGNIVILVSNVSTLVLIRVLFFLTSFLYINDISLNRPCIIYIYNNRKK